jgi:hypothetical protein
MMIAVRIWKKLESPIAGLPELDPLIGKTIEMIAMEDPDEELSSVETSSTTGSNKASAPQANVAPSLPTSMAGPPPPPRRRVRICGTVERVGDGGDTFRLAVDGRHVVPCAWAADGPSPAVGAAGRPMVVAGTGIFDTSGVILRVEVKAAAPALEPDHRFARMPTFADPETTEQAEPAPASIEPPILVDAMVADAPVPSEPPRPALSAASSFRELFRAGEGEAAE